MSKQTLILILLIINCLIDVSLGLSDGKNLLISADFTHADQYIMSGPHDFVKVSVVKDRIVGRNTFPSCLAVGCTKSGLICDLKKGQMIKTFRSVNDTRQAYFRSSLTDQSIILSINCREHHIACCFQTIKVAAPVVHVNVNSSVHKVIPVPPMVPIPAKVLMGQVVNNTLGHKLNKHPVPTGNATLLPPNSTTIPAQQPLPPKPPTKPPTPIKLYLFSNICWGFLGGAGFVQCNRR